MGMTTNAIVTA